MKSLPVGELKAHFSKVLEEVKEGESYGILYGRKKQPVAMIVPFKEPEERNERELGILEGKHHITFADDFAMTEEELLGME